MDEQYKPQPILVPKCSMQECNTPAPLTLTVQTEDGPRYASFCVEHMPRAVYVIGKLIETFTEGALPAPKLEVPE